MMIIIDNLISNSIKAKSTNIKITFNAINNDYLIIKFKDNGIGIPKNIHDDIFKFGFTTTKGTGIGLHQVKKIMNEYGDITINTELKKGAEFILRVKQNVDKI